MFPGFVSIYKDDNKYINLYFYPGLSDDGTDIYKPLELTNEYEYIKNCRPVYESRLRWVETLIERKRKKEALLAEKKKS